MGANEPQVQACTRYIIINSVAYIKIDGENLRKEIREDTLDKSQKLTIQTYDPDNFCS